MLDRHEELKKFEKKVFMWLRINGIRVEYLNTEDHSTMILQYKNQTNMKKCVLCWNEFKSEYMIYNLDEWDSYLDRWYAKNRKKILEKIMK